MHILIACDKFRGSLTAAEANAAIAAGLAQSALSAHATFVCLPIADGGEGTIDALSGPGTARVEGVARGPFGGTAPAYFAHDAGAGRAVIEMAAIAGHAAAKDAGYDPDKASSVGVGDLILAALDAGAHEIVVALGGSISVDGGAGALHALGGRFADASGKDLGIPAGRALARVAGVDLSGLDPRAGRARIIVAADVDNPLTGPNGAAAVFGPQKGVKPEEVAAFDAALGHFDDMVAAALGRGSYAAEPFAGAAGGMMTGLSAISPTTATDGFALVQAHHKLEEAIRRADLVVTGEGSLDGQSLGGKGPVGIARMAMAAGVPCLAFAGRVAAQPDALGAAGVTAAFAIAQGPQTLDDALGNAAPSLTVTARAAFALYESALRPGGR
ncbi:glycerate kinase [Acuticoccus sp. MNP-M23]|uniref:glycerate kinase n=1 Tax=Acuticoccus sp. MNP-M23 TaxID=3072793 RepID=UPI002815CE40|nr:glycerate kinase [Acuticoccus sp. MNP-M23]WMS40838.1 glycerate kinase [Acuticoccus sp. MNP-M23]